MQYISYYDSPLGKMLLAADEIGLTGVWFDEQKYFARCLDEAYEEKEIPLFADVKKWFDVYFQQRNRIFRFRSIWSEQSFRWKYGRYSVRFLMEKR